MFLSCLTWKSQIHKTQFVCFIFLFVLMVFSSLSFADPNEFTFYDLIVTVIDAVDHPVENAYVKAYSIDWPVAYPQSWYQMTDALGHCLFHLPRGNWKIVAGKDNVPGLFVFDTISLETTAHLQLKPDHIIEINVLDRMGNPTDWAQIYAAPSSMVPNCLMPPSGWTQNGTCVIETNAAEELNYFIVRSPTNQQEGYFLFTDSFSATENPVIDASTMELNHIHFDGRSPDDTPGMISWIMCFPYQDIERMWWHTDIWLDGEGDAYLNVDYLNYFARSKRWSEELHDDIWYNFQYQAIDFTVTPSVSLTVGGSLTPAFHFLPIPFDNHRSMFMFGPVFDAHGNELRYYAPNTAERIAIPLVIREYGGGPILYNDELIINSDNLAFQIEQGFPETSVFRFEWNLPGYGGLHVMEGSLYDPNYRYPYYTVSTPHFEIHAPAWMSDKSEWLGIHWEQAYEKMVSLLGSSPPLTSEKNYYIHPLGTWASIYGQELYYHGFTWWHPRNPIMWEDTAFHEIGHRMVSELFNQQPDAFPLEHVMNEAVAEMISHYTIAQTHGPEFARLILNDRSHRFFAYMDNPNKAPFEAWHSLFFFLEVYLPKSHSWEINKLFFKNLIEASIILDPLGYNQPEIYAALYSVLAGENLSWIFELSGFPLDEGRIENAVSQISHLNSEVMNLDDLAWLARYWQITDCDPMQDCYYIDWHVDRRIDIFDLAMLAENWMSVRINRIFSF